MNNFRSPVADQRFVIHQVLDAPRALADLPPHADTGAEIIDAILEEGGRFCDEVIAPLYQPGDAGCTFKDGEVTAPAGFKEAYLAFALAGWSGATAPPEEGGQGLPYVVDAALKEQINGANMPWGNFPLLGHGAIEALRQQGQDWQKQVFLKPLVEGIWTGTMCLTEPHCGTDLGLLKTKAEPVGDDRYAISGQKIFITAGEHDFTDNIIHLVLARLPDAPAGVRGISLFVVPKFKVDRDGSVGERNAVWCGSIEHKMGLHGSATCVMNFDGAEGYLVGQPHKGLSAMFIMMNSARLGVGIQGLGLTERAWQNALAYANDRLQMRAPEGARYPERPADPLIVHPDIRRMLLTCRAFAEGGRVLALFACLHEDLAAHATSDEQRQQADTVVGFLTPIVKGLLTEAGVECAYHAQQVFGGHGYIAEWGMEQLARDVRITTLYEGTTQIQALDLIGRKTLLANGAGLKLMLTRIGEFCRLEAENPAVIDLLPALADRAEQWRKLTAGIGAKAADDPALAPAIAYDYLFYSGYVLLAWCWAQRVAAAERSELPAAFKRAQRETANFYFQRLLPRCDQHAAIIANGAAPVTALSDEDIGASL
ncbi:MAG: acyl-CoA dehydrogenase C-terminal domain-containing protein [Xanthomonadales bacterium]|nr:acyl-CoA dehydrogenase C-terminal domain-containing protein [Xanthomonadales bacterium]